MNKFLFLLVAAFLLLAGVLVEPSVSRYLEQRSELEDVKEDRARLRAEIAEINSDIEGITNDRGVRHAARCYGPFVEPGEEVYSVPGLQGCVVSGTD